MNELKDIDIREALKRREARRAKPEVPADFCNNVMQEIAPKKRHPMIWRWMAAASILLIIGIGTMVWQKETGEGSEANTYVVQNVETLPKLESPSPLQRRQPQQRKSQQRKPQRRSRLLLRIIARRLRILSSPKQTNVQLLQQRLKAVLRKIIYTMLPSRRQMKFLIRILHVWMSLLRSWQTITMSIPCRWIVRQEATTTRLSARPMPSMIQRNLTSSDDCCRWPAATIARHQVIC